MKKEISSVRKKRKKVIEMFKEAIISIISIVIIIIGNGLTNSYAGETVGEAVGRLEELKEIIIQEDNVNKEEAQDKIKNIYDTWNDKHSKLAYFIEHDELEKIETSFTEIKTNIEIEEYGEATVQLEKCIYILKHVENKMEVKLENIF